MDVPPDASEELLRLRIRDLEHDKQLLKEELAIKNLQIEHAHEHAKESQELMKQLHVLLKNMQDRALPQPAVAPLMEAAAASPVGRDQPASKPRKPAISKRRQVKALAAKEKTAKSLAEKYVPTFHTMMQRFQRSK
jgi:hypothetical protein